MEKKYFDNTIIIQYAAAGIPLKVYVNSEYLTITGVDDIENPIYGFGMRVDGSMQPFNYADVEHLLVAGNIVNLETYNKAMADKFKTTEPKKNTTDKPSADSEKDTNAEEPKEPEAEETGDEEPKKEESYMPTLKSMLPESKRGLSKIAKQIEELSIEMKQVAAKYKAAKDSGKQSEISKYVAELKTLTTKKKELEKHMTSAIEDLDKDAELKVDESINEKAESRAQQRAAGIALAVKRGKLPKSALKGSSKEMFNMSTKELEKYASTSHKGLPAKVHEDLEGDKKKSEKLEKELAGLKVKIAREEERRANESYDDYDDYDMDFYYDHLDDMTGDNGLMPNSIVGIDTISEPYMFQIGDMIQNINPSCQHYGSKGIVMRMTPNDVTYTVTNSGDTYMPGDRLTKTTDQLELI
jgi:hypothetical protein